MCLVVLSPTAALAADGPGYGGNANTLRVNWVKKESKPAPEPADPTTSPSKAPPPRPTETGAPAQTSEPPQTATTPAREVPKSTKPDPSTQSNGGNNSSPAAQRAPQSSGAGNGSSAGSTRGSSANSGQAQPSVSDRVLSPVNSGTAGFAQPAMIFAAEVPLVTGEVQDLSLAISGIGFESGAKVDVRVGETLRERTEASVVGSLNFDIPGIQLTSNEPGQTIVASGLGPAGAPIVLTGSIPPVPDAGGPIAYASWLILGVGSVWAGIWIWRKFGSARQPADPAGEATATLADSQ